MRQVTILHYNDVYNIAPREAEPSGGAARLATLFKRYGHLNPLIVFGGDALNPSLMSTVTQGKHMIPILNALNTHVAVFGNHDFDFGMDELEEVTNNTNFPWLISNVTDNFTGESLADGLVTHMIEWGGVKIGMMGLVEGEWLDTLAAIDVEDITYTDYVDCGIALAKQLKEEGADIVIALTHMRWPNDIRLAEKVEGIDLVLGGHDHDVGIKEINGKYVIKSGTDFRNASLLTLTLGDGGDLAVDVELLTADSSVEEDPEVKQIVDRYLEELFQHMDTVLGCMEVELEARFAKIRTEETNLGNFVTDIMLSVLDADIALSNSGTFRSDTVHPLGEFRLKDLRSILPMNDPLLLLKVTGEQVICALENGVSQYPKLEGRFPQVAGISFAFDPKKPPGNRVDPRFVKVQGDYIKMDKVYKLCTKQYIAEGKDGYEMFKKCPVIVDDEGPILATCVQNYFNSVHIVQGTKPCRSMHRQSLLSVHKRKNLSQEFQACSEIELSKRFGRTLSRQETFDTADMNVRNPSRASLVRQASLHCASHASRVSLVRQESIYEVEVEVVKHALAPKVEGRIIKIEDEATLHRLLSEREAWEHSFMEVLKEVPEEEGVT